MSAELPGWADMSDLDKGAALLCLFSRGLGDGRPARYFDHPALTALSPEAASAHAALMAGREAELLRRGDDEYCRLIDAALDASHARARASREAS